MIKNETVKYSFHVDQDLLLVSFVEPGYEFAQEYDIAPISILDEGMLDDHQRGQSRLIAHLASKVWASTQLLYDLAEHINHFHPCNKIDWVETFLEVELSRICKRHVDELYADTPDSTDYTGRVFTYIKHRAVISDELVNHTRSIVLEELGKRAIS